jgi:hypothetical protein
VKAWIISALLTVGHYLHKAFAPEILSNWILVLVGIGGVIAALLTLKAIKRQADLQSVAMQQWLETENWRTEVVHHDDGAGEITISFDVFNRTNFVLTVNEAQIRPQHHEFVKRLDYRLGPNKKVIFDVFFPITRAQNAARGEGNLRIIVSVLIGYTDAMKNKMYHSEVGIVQCSNQRATFTPKGFEAVEVEN